MPHNLLQKTMYKSEKILNIKINPPRGTMPAPLLTSGHSRNLNVIELGNLATKLEQNCFIERWGC